MPKHVTPETLRAVIKGLDYLADQQADDGSWITGGGQAYPVAMTGLAGTALLAHGDSPTRGKYAKNVQGAVEYPGPLRHARRDCSPARRRTAAMPMHGHGFALMFLASVYGMITKESLRRQVQAAIRKAVTLTSQGQSAAGRLDLHPRRRRRRLGDGHPGAGPAGGAQRRASWCPRAVIEEAVQLPREMPHARRGHPYSLGSGGGPRLPISAAAVATLYNAGQFDGADRRPTA